MSFVDAVRTCLTKYVDFSGRARRSEYWWFALFLVVVRVVSTVLDGVLGTQSGSVGIVSGLTSLALLLPGLAVTARRLHDIGKSGWLMLIGIIPIVGWIMLIVWTVKDSDQGPNAYGQSPKAVHV